MRISDWSSDVCSSDLPRKAQAAGDKEAVAAIDALAPYPQGEFTIAKADGWRKYAIPYGSLIYNKPDLKYYFQTPRLSPEYTPADVQSWSKGSEFSVTRSEEHTSELPSLMRTSYAVFCLKK